MQSQHTHPKFESSKETSRLKGTIIIMIRNCLKREKLKVLMNTRNSSERENTKSHYPINSSYTVQGVT